MFAKGSGGLAWEAQFWICGLAAATMLWVNHRGCLEAIGGRANEYYGEVRLEIGRFLKRLRKKQRQAASTPPLRVKPVYPVLQAR